VRTFWNQLTSKQSQLLEREIVKARPRVATVLAVAVTAGASWDRAVDLAASEIPVAALEDWKAINQRIKWGVPVPQAFSEGSGDWQQIAVVVDQTLRTGAPLAGALFALSNYWQEASYSEQVNQIERKASRMVVLVTLLQLPAFILLGLVPLVAASLIPLFEIFLSTTA
jgi:Flp pilus assembly protein TadB